MAVPKASQKARYQGKRDSSTFPKHREMTEEEITRANERIVALQKLVKSND